MFIFPYSSWQPSCFLSPTGGEGERLLCIVWQGTFVSWERKCLPTDYKKVSVDRIYSTLRVNFILM